MRCKICDTILTDDEVRFKYPGGDEYADECHSCYRTFLNDIYDLDSIVEVFIDEDRE